MPAQRRPAAGSVTSQPRAPQKSTARQMVPTARRETLMAKPDPAKPGLYRFDIRVQGKDETVFFDV